MSLAKRQKGRVGKLPKFPRRNGASSNRDLSKCGSPGDKGVNVWRSKEAV